jgi:hypothetical protein
MTEDIPRFPRLDDEDIIEIMADKIADLQRRLSQLETAPADDLEIKTDAGDYATADSWDGRRVVNTADVTFKILINGTWRTLFP